MRTPKLSLRTSTMIQGSPETAAELHESDDSPTGDEEMNASNDEEGEDDEIDQVAGKICDLILQHFGGPGNGNFDDMIRIVESSATKFVIKLLNDLINCPQVVKCVQHEGSSSGYTPAGGEGNTQPPAGHGTRGPGDGVSDDEATGRGTGGGDNSPGSGENGMLDAKDLRPSYSPISCPFRKRNPLRFNPVDFHACATTAWNSLPLLKLVQPHRLLTKLGVHRLSNSVIIEGISRTLTRKLTKPRGAPIIAKSARRGY